MYINICVCACRHCTSWHVFSSLLSYITVTCTRALTPTLCVCTWLKLPSGCTTSSVYSTRLSWLGHSSGDWRFYVHQLSANRCVFSKYTSVQSLVDCTAWCYSYIVPKLSYFLPSLLFPLFLFPFPLPLPSLPPFLSPPSPPSLPSLFLPFPSIRCRLPRVKIRHTNHWTKIRLQLDVQTTMLSCSLIASRRTRQQGIPPTNQILPPTTQTMITVTSRVAIPLASPRPRPRASQTQATCHYWRCTTSKTIPQTLAPFLIVEINRH